ncbi:hypothetical protein [Parapedobacter sp.]
MHQETLIDTIRRRIGTNKSLIDEIAGALDISYDAAHRRISMKSKFSIEEAVQLANHYGLSMDKLFQGSDSVLVRKTKDVQNFDDLKRYLESSYKYLTVHEPNGDTALFYSAKDIPLFYTINADLLSKFKLYVWLYLLNFENLGMSFDAFHAKAPVVDQGQKLNQLYASIQTHEIWNDTTINSTLQQVVYFFQSGLLSAEHGSALCDSVKELVFRLEQQCTDKNDQYRLYYHDMLILNNNVLISDPYKKSLFVPYTMLGYYITSDEGTCSTVYDFFQHQLKNSKLLNTAGTKDKKMFFNKVYRKIDFYKNQMAVFPDML